MTHVSKKNPNERMVQLEKNNHGRQISSNNRTQSNKINSETEVSSRNVYLHLHCRFECVAVSLHLITCTCSKRVLWEIFLKHVLSKVANYFLLDISRRIFKRCIYVREYLIDSFTLCDINLAVFSKDTHTRLKTFLMLKVCAHI